MNHALPKLGLCVLIGLAAFATETSAQSIYKPAPSNVSLNNVYSNLARYFGDSQANYLTGTKASLYSQFLSVLHSTPDATHVLKDGATLLSAHLANNVLVRAAVIYDNNGVIKSAALLRPRCVIQSAPEIGLCQNTSTYVLTIFSSSSNLPSDAVKKRFRQWAKHSVKKATQSAGSPKSEKRLVTQVRTLDDA